MALLEYTLSINIDDPATLDILNDAPYKLRVGNPPVGETKDFEPADNTVDWDFVEGDGNGSNEALTEKTIITMTFTAGKGWVYSIGYKLPGKTNNPVEVLEEHDIIPGQIYDLPDTGGAAQSKDKSNNDKFVTDKVFGVTNKRTAAFSLLQRPDGLEFSSSEKKVIHQTQTWFPGFGTLPVPPDTSNPGSIYVWLETSLAGARHEATGLVVQLGKVAELALFVHSDGTLKEKAEEKAGLTATTTSVPPSKG